MSTILLLPKTALCVDARIILDSVAQLSSVYQTISVYTQDTTFDSPIPSRNLKLVHSSTPDNSNFIKHKSKEQNTVRILNVNFQSIKTKQGQVHHLQDSIKIDIIYGTEIRLDSSIKDSQIFTLVYSIFRNDRNLDGKGVFIAGGNNLISLPAPK